jgi:hypothetical protein
MAGAFAIYTRHRYSKKQQQIAEATSKEIKKEGKKKI